MENSLKQNKKEQPPNTLNNSLQSNLGSNLTLKACVVYDGEYSVKIKNSDEKQIPY